MKDVRHEHGGDLADPTTLRAVMATLEVLLVLKGLGL